jgi:hypothetical protein
LIFNRSGLAILLAYPNEEEGILLVQILFYLPSPGGGGGGVTAPTQTTSPTHLDIILSLRPKVINNMAVGAAAKDRDLVVGRGRLGLPEVDEVALNVGLCTAGGGGDGPLDAEGGGAQRQDVLQLGIHRGSYHHTGAQDYVLNSVKDPNPH